MSGGYFTHTDCIFNTKIRTLMLLTSFLGKKITNGAQ